MDIANFFKHDNLALPLKNRNANQTFIQFYLESVKLYFNEFEKLKLQESEKCDFIRRDIIRKEISIRRLFAAILKAIMCTLNGHPAIAYNHFKEGLKFVHEDIDNLTLLSRSDLNMNQLYRIRTIESHEDVIKPTGMLHVPYHLRHLVKPQRYSLPGVPCLYLGGSLYVCWEELKRPKFENIYFARFSARQEKLCLLDFGYKPKAVGDLISSLFRECCEDSPLHLFTVANAVCWPLLTACSIRPIHKEAPFYHEYIIPQLLLQWITANDNPFKFHGIRYFSVASNSICQNPSMLCNYVFPCQGIEKKIKKNSTNATNEIKDEKDEWENYNKEILELFKFSEPLYWPIVEKTIFPDDVSHRVPQQRNIELQGPGIFKNYYEKTPFGIMEGKSLNYEVKDLMKNKSAIEQ
jgi:hypothetical protein